MKPRRRLRADVAELEVRVLLDAGNTIGTAAEVGRPGAGRSLNDSISTAGDVDVFRIDLKAGETVRLDVDTTTNGYPGLGSYLRLFNAQGAELAANNDAQAPDEPPIPPNRDGSREFFDSYVEYHVSMSGTYYVGVSNWENTYYNVVSGGNVSIGSNHLTGSYQLTISVASPSRLPPGVYVAGRNLNMTGGSLGTHQYLILVPNGPYQFSTRDLGDGTQGIVIGAHNRRRLKLVQFETADVRATREYVNLAGSSGGDFDTTVALVNIGSRSLTTTIARLLDAGRYYARYEKRHPIPYPSIGQMLRGRGLNSNSWVQSLVQYVVGPRRVQEDFPGNDLLHEKRIPRRYFIAPRVRA